MRQLLSRWAELEPEKIDSEHWDDPVTGDAGSEFRIAGVAVYSDLFEIGENNPALIQWAVQEAIIARGWDFSLEWSGEWIAWINDRWTGDDLSSPAKALLSAYLKALEVGR